MKDFIEQFYQQTGDGSDRISKDIFLELYRNHYNLKHISWDNLRNDIKRLGIKYCRTLRKGNLKGCILGLKDRESADNDNEASWNEESDEKVNNDVQKKLPPRYMFIDDVENEKKNDARTPTEQIASEYLSDDEANKKVDELIMKFEN